MDVKMNDEFVESSEEKLDHEFMDLQTLHINKIAKELAEKEMKIIKLEAENMCLNDKLEIEIKNSRKYVDLWKKERIAKEKAERNLENLKGDIFQTAVAFFHKIKNWTNHTKEPESEAND